MAFSLQDMDLVLRAASFAAVKHRAQRRKDGNDTPYINHPLDVAKLLTEVGKVTDPLVLAAGLLHDTVEDTNTTLEEIALHFNQEVSNIVAEVTDDKSLPKVERKRLQIRHAPQKTQSAKLVKLGDKLSNLTELKHSQPKSWGVDRIRGYFVWAKRVVDGLAGTNEFLEQRLAAIFAGEFTHLGVQYSCLPKANELDDALENYLESLTDDFGKATSKSHVEVICKDEHYDCEPHCVEELRPWDELQGITHPNAFSEMEFVVQD